MANRPVTSDWTRSASVRRTGRPRGRGTAIPLDILAVQPPHLFEDGVERKPTDELHHIKVNPLVLTNTEDRHDIVVVQPRSGLGFAMEADERHRVQKPMTSKHLERDAAAQRLLNGLIHDSHAAAPDFSQEMEFAEPIHERADPGDRRSRQAPGNVARARLEVLDQTKNGKELANFVSNPRIARGIFLECRPLASAAPLEKLLGEILDLSLIG